MLSLVLKGTTGELPTSEYELLDDDQKVGFIQIRHRPSGAKEVPPNMASHIYYEIYPPYRGKGYGKQILKLGLNEARKIGLKEVLLTCYEENVASKKIIEANGGTLVESMIIPATHKKFLKYKIVI